MTRRELEGALAEAERVRDEWCAEYVKVRDALERARRWRRKWGAGPEYLRSPVAQPERRA